VTTASSLLSLPGNLRAIKRAIADLASRADREGRRHWLSVRREIDSRDVLEEFASAFSHPSSVSDAFYWEESGRDRAILGLGRLCEIEATGPDRFARASEATRELFDSLVVCDLDRGSVAADGDDRSSSEPSIGPMLVGGFGFYSGETAPESEWIGLGPGRLVLPEHLIVCREGRAWSTSTFAVAAGGSSETIFSEICRRMALTDAYAVAAAESGVSPLSSAPSISLAMEHEEMGLGLEVRVQADRPHVQYRRQVAAAVDGIAAGKFEKVVLARSLVVESSGGFDIPSFLGSLRELYPSCAVIALKQGDDCFVSASPERLISLEDGRVETVAVAGTAPRGRSPEEEAHFSNELLSSAKEAVEHELVKKAIRRALEPSCTALEGPASPEILKLEGIQHLSTTLAGRLLESSGSRPSVLDLVSRLHPTPAVCGTPTAIARDWLEQFEALDRGWYAGPIGFVDARGDGEFRVALRSALLKGDRARLFAGAGIVSGSNPERELAETRLKLRALLAPLTEI
jgi:isochorismate synthase